MRVQRRQRGRVLPGRGPACASCARKVRLKGASPQGRICSACTARRHHGRCACCARHATLVGRNGEGQPWCGRCYSAVAAARLAQARRSSIVSAVRALEPGLTEAAVLAVVQEVAGVRRLGQLARHLQTRPDTFVTGPTSMPPVLDRLVRALVAAGAITITVIHPRCLDCGRSRPAQQRLTQGVLCSACHARRTAAQRCVGCGRLRRPGARDEAGDPRCAGCVHAGRHDTERAQLVEHLTTVLTGQTSLDVASITGVLTAVAPRRHDLRGLTELLAGHHLTEPVLPFLLSRLVIALRAAGADLPIPPCQTCQQPSGPGASLHLRQIRCRACAQRCPHCGKARRREGERQCRQCRLDRHRRRGSCGHCHQPDRLLDDQGWCRWCRERAARSCADCHRNRTLTAAGGRRICQPCALRATVDGLLADQPPGALHTLRAPILAAEPYSTRRWLRRPTITALLTDLDTGRLALTHAALDEQPTSAGVEHLRDLLLATGALAPEPERLLDRLLDDAHQRLTSLQVGDARIVRSWLRWQVLPRLRRHLQGPVDIRAATANARRALSQVVVFITTIEDAGHTLTDCEQRALDSWFSTRKAGRHQIRPFLAWAQRARHLPATLTLPPPYQGPSQTRTDPEERWALAHRLVQDTTLDVADRVAGALVVLYAQPLVRICALTTDDIHSDGQSVTVRVGAQRLELPEPFSALIQMLPLPRRDGVAEQLPSNWLFPGHRAGRHLAAVNLGNRLRAIGIEPRAMRLAALDQLSKEIPPALLTEILGLKAPQTVRHTSQAGGDWAQYAAHRST